MVKLDPYSCNKKDSFKRPLMKEVPLSDAGIGNN